MRFTPRLTLAIPKRASRCSVRRANLDSPCDHPPADLLSYRPLGVINLTCTPTGRLLLRQWTLRPSLELEVIEARHSAIECFLRSENREST